jgi:hypothetical protein
VALNIGDIDCGGLYAGVSASTGKPLHAALSDEPACLTYADAQKAARRMRKIPGREGAHVPTPEELDENLFQNRARGGFKGSFNTTGSVPKGCYLTSVHVDGVRMRVQYFDEGERGYAGLRHRRAVRLVW